MNNRKIDIKQVITLVFSIINLYYAFLGFCIILEYFDILNRGYLTHLQFHTIWSDILVMILAIIISVNSVSVIIMYFRHKQVKLIYPIVLFFLPFLIFLVIPYTVAYFTNFLTIVLIILFFIFLLVSIFLGKEFLKKFKFMQKFVQNSNQLIEWKYQGSNNGEKGMRNIVLRGNKPFSVLVGFKLGIPLLKYSGFDYYGYVRSNDNNIAIFSTYMGQNPSIFQLLISTNLKDNPITVSSTDDDQQLSPQVLFKPHWFQKMGFYG